LSSKFSGAWSRRDHDAPLDMALADNSTEVPDMLASLPRSLSIDLLISHVHQTKTRVLCPIEPCVYEEWLNIHVQFAEACRVVVLEISKAALENVLLALGLTSCKLGGDTLLFPRYSFTEKWAEAM
jgi:hypothetical protein